LDNDKEIFNKPNCDGNFVYYQIENDGTSTVVDSGVSRFEFANSLVFQFSPCDIDSQDYIKYDYDTTKSGVSIFKSNNDFLPSYSFPPTGSITRSGGENLPLIYLDSNNEYSEVFGSFQYTKIIQNNINNANLNVGTSVSLINTSFNDQIVTLTVSEIKPSIEGNINISDSGTCYTYGDIWYATETGTSEISTYGFVVPISPNGSVVESSLIQLKDFITKPEKDLDIFISSKTGTNFSCGVSIQSQNVKKYFLEKDLSATGTLTSGTYKNNQNIMELDIIVSSGEDILQQNEAIFTSLYESIPENSQLYFPSYNVKENIKAKAISVIGNNYVGNINYNNNGFRNNSGDVVPVGLFSSFKNYVYSNKITENNEVVIYNDTNTIFKNVQNTFIINFSESVEDNIFSIKLNYFSKPISSPNSNIQQKNNQNLGAINSNSVNSFSCQEIKDVVGVNMKIDFNEFLGSQDKYVPPTGNNKPEIPGNTNTQIQIREIRQNNSNQFIDTSDNCSIFFSPIPNPLTNLDGDSEFLQSQNNSNPGGIVDITSTKQTYLYNNVLNTIDNERFNPDFTSSKIIYQPNNEISFYLGNNLFYVFIQDDSSNSGSPLVFSSQSGGNFLANIYKENKNVLTDGDLYISYFLNSVQVSYSDYTNITKFNKETDRNIRLIFISQFSRTDISETIYYGVPESNGDQRGGRFDIIYH